MRNCGWCKKGFPADMMASFGKGMREGEIRYCCFDCMLRRMKE